MKKYRTFIIIMVLVGFGILYFYNYEANDKKKNETSESKVQDLEKLINKDLEKTYPQTPREVVKLYSRIITCFYNEDYSEDEKKALALQARLLMDSELLEKNPFESYYIKLGEDIEEYKSNNKRITTYILEKADDIKYKTLNAQDYAMIECIYYVKGKSGTVKTDETYTLRKDDSGKWKILFWELTGDEKNEDE